MLKNFFKKPIVLFALVFILLYVFAEIMIRGEALNKLPCGYVGWAFWCIGIAFIVFYFMVPLLGFVGLPLWKDLENISESSKKSEMLEKYGKYLVRHFDKKSPVVIEGELKEVRLALALSDPILRRERLESIIPCIREKLFKEVCGVKIRKYIKQGALFVAISQKGWLDSTILFIIQVKLIKDICRCLGFRPSWTFMSCCLSWVLANSVLAGILEDSDLISDNIEEIIGIAGYDTAGNIAGKFAVSLAQALSAGAIIYSTGELVRRRLLGEKQNFRKKIFSIRLNGYKETKSVLIETAPHLFNNVKNILNDFLCKN